MATSSGEIRNHAERLAYLNCPSKILATLANEYGTDRRLPSRTYLQGLVDDRRAKFQAAREKAARLGMES